MLIVSLLFLVSTSYVSGDYISDKLAYYDRTVKTYWEPNITKNNYNQWMKASDVGTIVIKSDLLTPLIWCKEKKAFGALYERWGKKALIVDWFFLNSLRNGYPDKAISDYWKGLLFNWKKIDFDFTLYWRYKYLVEKNMKYDGTPYDFYWDWMEDPEILPMLIVHPGLEVPKKGSFMYELANIMGFEFSPEYPMESCRRSWQPISNLTLTYPEDSVMLSLDFRFKGLLADFTYANKFYFGFNLRKYSDPMQTELMAKSTWPGDLLKILKKGNYYMSSNTASPSTPYDYTKGTYNEQAYKLYYDFALSEGVSKITGSWYLEEAFGEGGGFSFYWRLSSPTTYTLISEVNNTIKEYQSLGIYAYYNTMKYEVLSEVNGAELCIGALTEDLGSENPIKRAPFAHHRIKLEKTGSITSLVGGPMSIKTNGKKIKVKFTNVPYIPTISLVNPATFTEWNKGRSMGSKLRWAELYCYTVYLTMQNTAWGRNTAENIAKICKIYDSILASLLNYFGAYRDVRKDRPHIIFDPHPKGNKPHTFEGAIILDAADQSKAYSIAQTFGTADFDLGDLSPFYDALNIPKVKISGVDIGRAYFAILYKQNWLSCTVETCNLNAAFGKKEDLEKFIKGETSTIDSETLLVLYFYQLQKNFGKHIIGNLLKMYASQRIVNENLGFLVYVLTIATGKNMIPSMYLFQIQGFDDATYKEYYGYNDKLTVYEPHGYLSEDTLTKWEATKQFFGFTDSEKVEIEVDAKYVAVDTFENPKAMNYVITRA